MAYRDIEINIGYDSLYTEIDKITGYTGAKASEDGALYRTLASQEEDHELLQSFVLDAEDVIGEVLYLYLGDSSFEKSIRYVLRMPSNWHESTEIVRKDIFWYMVYYAAMRWFRAAGGEVAAKNEEKYAKDCTEKLDDIRKIINRRARPKNPYAPAVFDEGERIEA